MKKGLWIVAGLAVLTTPVAIVMVFIMFLTMVAGAGYEQQRAQQCVVGGQDGAWSGSVPASAGPVRWPVTGRWTPTSEFGMRVNPGAKEYGKYKMHNGLDMAMSTPGPVVAVKDGVIKRILIDGLGGNQVYIDIGGSTIVGYSHLRDRPTLKPGDRVKAGQAVGIEGATGNVSGAHLHFSVQQGEGNYVNPRTWLDAQGLKVPALNQWTSAPGTGVGGAGTAGASATNVASSSSSSTAPSADGISSANLPLPGSNRSASTSSNPKPIPIPANWKRAYDAAAAKYGLPWTLMAGIGAEETRQGQMVRTSSAGAQGPTQFMPATFAAEGVDGNGDGKKDIQNVDDAIHSTAAKLVRDGAKQGPAGVRKAIFAYNHAEWYVNDVLYWAQVYGGGSVPISGEALPGQGCADQGMTLPSVGGDLPPVPADGGNSSLIVQAARSALGTPYAWGGGTIHGPSMGTGIGAGVVGYDCSGLTLWAVYRGTGIQLPHKADEIAFTSKGQVISDKSKLQPGDVIAFSEDGTGRRGTFGHIGIYLGGNQMIHAPVQGQNVKVTDISTPYWGAMRWSIHRFAPTSSA
ncbi:NlpC/P60 family protein [Dermacoccus abyssi]